MEQYVYAKKNVKMQVVSNKKYENMFKIVYIICNLHINKKQNKKQKTKL